MKKKKSHPYIPSGGPLAKTFDQFRKNMPSNVDAKTLKKLSLAPNNENMILSVFHFLGFLDEKGTKTEQAAKVFSQHNDTDFAKALEPIVKKFYSDLFDSFGEETWKKDRNSLIAYFRNTDGTSALTGKRQAFTFETLAALSGHRKIAEPKALRQTTTKKTDSKPKPKTKTSVKKQEDIIPLTNPQENNLGLTVRIEINLPAQGDQETYDRIFQSINKNLLNG